MFRRDGGIFGQPSQRLGTFPALRYLLGLLAMTTLSADRDWVLTLHSEATPCTTSGLTQFEHLRMWIGLDQLPGNVNQIGLRTSAGSSRLSLTGRGLSSTGFG